MRTQYETEMDHANRAMEYFRLCQAIEEEKPIVEGYLTDWFSSVADDMESMVRAYDWLQTGQDPFSSDDLLFQREYFELFGISSSDVPAKIEEFRQHATDIREMLDQQTGPRDPQGLASFLRESGMVYFDASNAPSCYW